MDKFKITGGVYYDTTFSQLREGTYEEYGPFHSYEDAYKEWQARMWQNVDNALHRLKIEEE